MRLRHNVMPLQEGYGALDALGGVLLSGTDAHDMHILGAVQPYSLEHVQSTSRVQAPVVGHDHCSALGQGGGDGNDRTRTMLEHRVEGVVGLWLGFKVKKGMLTEQNQVIPLGLQENTLGGEPDLL